MELDEAQSIGPEGIAEFYNTYASYDPKIDVKEQLGNIVKCTLYADGRAVQMFISTIDYIALVQDGFFIRDGKELDSANVINTTEVYEIKKR